ncbi:MAG: UDP-N-acetylglucosamine 2-epimerase (non-hydrolyzing) [Chloroflexota bacterium]|nr:MAG: UDP-N-acetylglucosamine 2-epimerase (non-hydrolyzing) [Chloroflexota bacterium]
MRIVTIVGARPQFIKAAPMSRVLRRAHEEYLIHTGQHYDAGMSDVFFEELGIPQPDLNLGIGGLSNLEQVSRMMLALREPIEAQRPDWILIYGDTNSTLAGALTGRLLGVPVAHIEAGLRSYNPLMPEELNRVVADRISAALFCPTETAAANLAREGITDGVYVVGDVMADALLQNRERASTAVLEANDLHLGQYFLATVHRAGNTDDPEKLKGILDAFARLPLPVVLPAHPRLQRALEQTGLAIGPNVRLIPPVGYLDMLGLTSSARLVLTDSGGLQKEAYILGVPCVTLREETEWVETVEAGWNRLAGTDCARIVAAVEAALSETPQAHPELYGDGRACERIVAALES